MNPPSISVLRQTALLRCAGFLRKIKSRF
jgi:hypothetical protein